MNKIKKRTGNEINSSGRLPVIERRVLFERSLESLEGVLSLDV